LSDLGRLRKRLAQTEGQIRRWERELAELRDEYRLAQKDERPELTRRGQHLRLVLDDAQAARERARVALETEEQRLLQPGAFLRFT